MAEDFLRPEQYDAVERMHVGSILNGGTGSGKSRTALYWYFKRNGGEIRKGAFRPMTLRQNLLIITTAAKRDKHEWEIEMAPFLLSPDPKLTTYPDVTVKVDSWNNIKKYVALKGWCVIFDEDRVTGSGVWVKSFYKIAAENDWVILSATPGDDWMDFFPVFKANGFFKTKREFEENHVVYDHRVKFPRIDRYLGTTRLYRLRERVLIDMDVTRHTVQHHEDVIVKYDVSAYRNLSKTRWNPYLDKPIETAAELCYTWRKVVNTDESRAVALLELYEKHPRMIVFYNFDYELDILKELDYGEGVEIAEWNGHKHQPIPYDVIHDDTDKDEDGNPVEVHIPKEKWVYLVQYTAGCEGWNCLWTDTIVFYSQNYSYKVMEQAAGRIDRLNTPFTDLHYYHLRSYAPIDIGIKRALTEKKQFNETRFVGGRFVNKNNKEDTHGEMAGANARNVSRGSQSPNDRETAA